MTAIDSTVRWEELGGRTTREFVVTGERGFFAPPGDSGAFVINDAGALVGIVIGGPATGA